jgi:hypothetical protein
MHELHTPDPSQKATVSRRSFLAAGAASTLVFGGAAVAEAADDNYDRLMMQLDLRDELVDRHEAAIHAFDEIDGPENGPQKVPSIDVRSFFGGEHVDRYYRSYGHYQLGIIDARLIDLHDFFEEQIELALNRAKIRPYEAEWPAVKAQDYAKAIAALHRQLQTREDWKIRTGFRAADAEVNRLLDEVCEIEEQIYTMPVRSFRDLRVKLGLVTSDKWDLDDRHLLLILASIGDFAEAGAA